MQTWKQYTAKEIRPDGWLKRQLRIQAEGLCGNLDKMWPDVRDSAWIGGDREGWERVPYWLDGFVPMAYLLEDEDMIARAKRYIDAILARQQADGWICPCKDEDRSNYDPWAIELITKTLKTYYDCSADPRIPDVLYRILRNLHELMEAGTVKLFDWGKHRWFETFIALNSLYARQPEPWMEVLARSLKDQGADYMDYVPDWKRPLNVWRQQTHIVNICMALKAEAVSCGILGEDYTDQAEYLRSVLEKYNGMPVETFTGDECLSGLSPIHGTELCGVVEQMYSYELLYAATGDPKWMERLEVLAFNALPAAISQDMWTHQYLQQSNQISCEKLPGRSLFRTNKGEAHMFGLEPHFGCCTANFGQGWPKFTLSAFMQREDTVISCLMVPCRLETEGCTIEVETDYPFRNRAVYHITAKKAFTFKIRVPSFAKNLQVDGKFADHRELAFAVKPGSSRVEVQFEAEPWFQLRPHDLHTVRCGSLVFSIPIAYTTRMHEYERNGVERKFPYCDYELIPQSNWNYGFCDTGLTLERGQVPQVPFSEGAVKIRARVQHIPWGHEPAYLTVCGEIPASTIPMDEPKTVEMIPYGCAKLRMTELPFV